MSSTKNIAKNSLFLYFRMFLNMGVGLFTAGVVLNTLGITDYGIYNIVGGFVSMFGFLNASMASATQRFLSFDIGRNDKEQLRKTFSSAVTIHFAIAVIIVFALETFGLWYINNKLNVPPNRLTAVNFVFQFSVLTSFFGIIQVPYNALITAHERFNVYAYISFIEIAFKLIILYLLVNIQHDKLMLYAAMLFVSSFIIRMIYRIYSRKNFPESKYRFYFDKSYFKTLLSFTGWNLFTNVAFISRNQGINLLLNMFYGTVINAAYGITSQVQGIVLNFVASFQNAVNPQIVKNYASGNINQSYILVQQSAKFSFGVMMILAFPIMISLENALNLWLHNYPKETVTFIRLAFINVLIDTICNPMVFLIQAVGKIRNHQIIVGALILLNIPISYIALHILGDPQVVFFVSICITFLSLVLRISFLKILVKINVTELLINVILRILVLSCVIFILYITYENYPINFPNKFFQFFCTMALGGISAAIFSYLILLTYSEKKKIHTVSSIFLKGRLSKLFK